MILDVIMPVMDGFEVCRRIRANPGHQPVIVMLTARAGTESMVAGLAAGADDYVVKPPNLDELVERIRSRLRQRLQDAGSSPLSDLGGGAQIAAEVQTRLAAGHRLAVACVDLRHFIHFTGACRPQSLNLFDLTLELGHGVEQMRLGAVNDLLTRRLVEDAAENLSRSCITGASRPTAAAAPAVGRAGSEKSWPSSPSSISAITSSPR